jgi:hypothetical protein
MLGELNNKAEYKPKCGIEKVVDMRRVNKE